MARRPVELNLHEGESLAWAILKTAANAIITIDDQGTITSFNTAAESLFGFTADETIGESIDLLIRSQKIGEQGGQLLARLTSDEITATGRSPEAIGLKKGGSRFPLELAVSEIAYEGGRLYTGIIRDISERKFAEVELTLAKEAAEAANKTKSEFLANVSHELRTPMTAILGYADLLFEEGDITQAPKNRIEAVQTIQRNGVHLLSIINDVLDLSKIEASKLSLESLACSPRTILEEVKSLMDARAREKGIEFEFVYETAVPVTIQTDPTRLRQILVNLISNAIKFTNEGSVKVITRLQKGDCPRMEFDVVDTGIGLSNEQRERLFQPFSQADTSTTRKYGGTGLGLTISKRLADMLGGGVSIVHSAIGIGTRFQLTIATGSLDGVPILNANSEFDANASTAKKSKPVELTRSLRDCRILLAEDGPDNQRLMSFILRKAGAEVTIAENGQVAIDEALVAREAKKPFDLILMDMQMPRLDGYTATRMLREVGYTVPVIALTANAMIGDREKCLEAGCDDYATKPVNRTKLIELICSHLLGPTHDDVGQNQPEAGELLSTV